MRKRELNQALRAAVPPASPCFGQTVRQTLAELKPIDEYKEMPVKRMKTKRRTLTFALAAVLLLASVAAAATLFARGLFDVTMGDTPQNAGSITQYDLARKTVGNTVITVKEAAYDGMSLYVLCSTRDVTAAEPLGAVNEGTGEREWRPEDQDTLDALNVTWWRDGLWIDGQYVSMPAMSVTEQLPGEENGEILYYQMLRLDQAERYLTGNVEIALPVGEPQANETLALDPQTGMPVQPKTGVLTFRLNCDTGDRVTVTEPNIRTEGARWSAKASRVVYSPLQLYITLDWEIRPEVLEAYIAENGDGYYEDGKKLWDYDALEVCGSEIMGMWLVDETGAPVFASMDGYYGCGSASNTQAWYTFPYADSYPGAMYLAPATDGEPDMTQAIKIR